MHNGLSQHRYIHADFEYKIDILIKSKKIFGLDIGLYTWFTILVFQDASKYNIIKTTMSLYEKLE